MQHCSIYAFNLIARKTYVIYIYIAIFQRVPVKKVTGFTNMDIIPQVVVKARYVTFELTAGCDGCVVGLHQLYFELCEEPVGTAPPTLYRRFHN